jgi:para-aminobenzoate synthetase component I
LCGLETFATVHHLVSAIEGRLSPQYTALDLLKATFPGGSITGCPKIRAMQIIAELESVVRGPYCGSIGYLGFNGCADLSITIRTFVIRDQHITFHAGGAITIDSDPEQEYQETVIKAKALMQTLASIRISAEETAII